MKPLTRNHIFDCENALKLTYINVEFEKFPRTSAQREREGSRKERREEERGARKG
jgi:hypothetical protein